MAFDKVIDSAALDAAMTYTADRIRAKTSGTEQIAWDSAKGFGDAVDAISGGSGEDLLAARLSNTMTSYSSTEIKSVINYGFGFQTKLENVSLPNCAVLNKAAFYGCEALTELYLPELIRIENNTFRNCFSLTEFISADKFDSRIDISTFEGCGKITKIDLHHVSKLGISNHAFACASLVTLIIRNTDFVAPLMTTVAFGASTTPINQGTGYIYVPAAMVSAYKAATNWSTFADQIRAIEDYPEITGG